MELLWGPLSQNSMLLSIFFSDWRRRAVNDMKSSYLLIMKKISLLKVVIAGKANNY